MGFFSKLFGGGNKQSRTQHTGPVAPVNFGVKLDEWNAIAGRTFQAFDVNNESSVGSYKVIEARTNPDNGCVYIKTVDQNGKEAIFSHAESDPSHIVTTIDGNMNPRFDGADLINYSAWANDPKVKPEWYEHAFALFR